MTPDIKLVSADEYNTIYKSVVKKVADDSDEETEKLSKEFTKVRKLIIAVLSQYWKENEDFEVQYDFGDYYHTSAGLYKPAIYCRKYIEVMWQAFEEYPLLNEWVYESILEPLDVDDTDDINWINLADGDCGDILFCTEGIFTRREEMKPNCLCYFQ